MTQEHVEGDVEVTHTETPPTQPVTTVAKPAPVAPPKLATPTIDQRVATLEKTVADLQRKLRKSIAFFDRK